MPEQANPQTLRFYCRILLLDPGGKHPYLVKTDIQQPRTMSKETSDPLVNALADVFEKALMPLVLRLGAVESILGDIESRLERVESRLANISVHLGYSPEGDDFRPKIHQIAQSEEEQEA